MARGSSYGDELREARLRKGMDLPSVARRLRVRADILAAIEDADFASLPPSGYTRNMVNAYARLVGADPRAVSEQYLDELHLFETGRSRAPSDSARTAHRKHAAGGSRASRAVKPRGESAQRSSAGALQRSDARERGRSYDQVQHRPEASRGYVHPSSRYRERYGNAPCQQPQRALPTARNSYGLDGSYRSGSSQMAPRATRAHAPSASRSYAESRGYGRETLRAYDSYAFQPGAGERGGSQPSRGRALPASEYATSPYAGLYSRRDHHQKTTLSDAVGAGLGALARRLPLVIGIIVVIVALIFIVSAIGNGGEPAPDETPTMPISGLTDTSTQNSDAYNMAATETAPTSAKFSYEVASGGRSWIELVVDGEDEVNEVVAGPESQEVEFTDSISFSCGNPTPVTIKLDGKVVEPTYSSRDEEYVYTVTFSSILAEWQRAHPTAPGIGSSSSSASSSSSSSSSSG